MRVSLRLFAAIPVLAAVLLVPARSADAAVFTLQFTGTYDTFDEVFHGERGSAVPFSYSLTYDTALDTDTKVYAAGSRFVGQYGLADDLHAYSASGIVAAKLTFGNHTWSSAGLIPYEGPGGVFSDFYLDADLNVAAPTLAHIRFGDSAGDFLLGLLRFQGDAIALENTSRMDDYSGYGMAIGSFTITTIPVAPVVPEPTSMVLLGTGLVALVVRRREKTS